MTGSSDSGVGHTLSGTRMAVAALGRSASGTAAFVEDCQVDGFDSSVSRQVEAASRGRASSQSSGPGSARLPTNAILSPRLPSRRASSSVILRAPSIPNLGSEPGRGSTRPLPGSHRRNSQAAAPLGMDSNGDKPSDSGVEASNEPVNDYSTVVRSGAVAPISSSRTVASRSQAASRSSIYAASVISAVMVTQPALAGAHGAAGQNVKADGDPWAQSRSGDNTGSAVTAGSRSSRGGVTVSCSAGQGMGSQYLCSPSFLNLLYWFHIFFLQRRVWRRLFGCIFAEDAHQPADAGEGEQGAGAMPTMSMLALAAPMPRSQETAAQQQQQTTPIARPASVVVQSIQTAPRPLPIIAVPLLAATSMAEASGVDKAAQLEALDLISQPGSAQAALLAAAPTVAFLADAPTAVDATAAGVTAASDATASGVTAAGATAVGIPDTTSQGPAPSPMTIHGSATSATPETVAAPLIKSEAAAQSAIVVASVPSAVADGGREGDSLADHHVGGGGGPPHLDDSSVPCKPVSERPLPGSERPPLPPPGSEHPSPPVVSSVEESSRVLPTVDKAAALVTLTRAVHDPVGVGRCIAEVGLVPHGHRTMHWTWSH